MGLKVNFKCRELGISVTGTPDLNYNGMPVEMKTTNELLVEGEETLENVRGFKLKWKSNYLPQLAMYSDACDMDWMLLLLVSKKTGRFSVIPVDGRAKLEMLREEWAVWSKDEKTMEKIEKYLQSNHECRV